MNALTLNGQLILPSASVGLGLVSDSWSCWVLHACESSCCIMVGQISCRPRSSIRDCSLIPYTARVSAARHWGQRFRLLITEEKLQLQHWVCAGAVTAQIWLWGLTMPCLKVILRVMVQNVVNRVYKKLHLKWKWMHFKARRCRGKG